MTDKNMTKEINNTDKLKKYCEFKNGEFYKFVVVIRKKDGDLVLQNKDHKERVVKEWFIESQEQLDKYLPDMINLAKATGGRLYMTVDPHSLVKTLFNMERKVIDLLDLATRGSNQLSVGSLKKLVSTSATVEDTIVSGNKHFLYDIDCGENSAVVVKAIKDICQHSFLGAPYTDDNVRLISTAEAYFSVSDGVVFDTVNGCHFVTKRVYDANRLLSIVKDNLREKHPEIDVNNIQLKTACLTLIYFCKEEETK